MANCSSLGEDINQKNFPKFINESAHVKFYFEVYSTRRFRASSYFFLVFSMMSGGNCGAGGF